MSHPQSKTGARIRTGSLILLGFGVVLFAASALIPASGAWYFDSRDGKVTATAASFGMAVSKGGSGVTVANLEYRDLAPGKTATDSFAVKNVGSIAGILTMYADDLQAGGISPVSVGKLSFTVNGRDDLSLSSGARVALGTLQAGESKTVSVAAALSDSAGNEWQGKTVTGALHLTMLQEQ